MEMQPLSIPEIKTFLGKRNDYCFSCDLEEGGSVLRWCLGKVILMLNGLNIGRGPRSFYKPNEAVQV